VTFFNLINFFGKIITQKSPTRLANP